MVYGIWYILGAFKLGCYILTLGSRYVLEFGAKDRHGWVLGPFGNMVPSGL